MSEAPIEVPSGLSLPPAKDGPGSSSKKDSLLNKIPTKVKLIIGTTILATLSACGLANKASPEPSPQGQSENSLSLLDNAIDKQKAEETPIAVYQVDKNEYLQIDINENKLPKDLGVDSKIDNIDLIVGIDPKNQQDAPVVARLVHFENDRSFVLFETKDSFKAYEYNSGFLLDHKDNFSYAFYLKTQDKNGQAKPIPFLEVHSSLNFKDVDPGLIKKAQSGDLQSIDELRNMILAKDKAQSIVLTDMVSAKKITNDQKTNSKWLDYLTTVVDLLTQPMPVQAAEEFPTPTAAQPTEVPTVEVLTPEQQLAEYMKTDEAKQSIDQFVNGMKMAQIKLDPSQVTQGLNLEQQVIKKQVEKKDENNNVVKDENGKPVYETINETVVVATYNIPGEAFGKGYESLGGDYPLFMTEKNEKEEWEWKEAAPGKRADVLGKKFGVFVDPRYNNPTPGIITDNFNLLSPGAFSWDWTRRIGPEIGSIDLSLADKWIDFAEQNGMSIINGNPLVYHHGLPEWLTSGNFTTEKLTSIMTEHIKTIVGHYAGKGFKWEVLNEAVWYYQNNTGYENSIWYKTIGKEYIDLAFQAAREADPSATLIYNDFTNTVAGKGSEIFGPKADVVFNLVKDLKQKGLVDEVGLQLHIFNPQTAPSEQEIIAQIQRYEEIGVPVNFTEVDVNIKPLLDKGMTLQEALKKQAEIYQIIVNACAKSNNCKGINIWGLNDRESWLGPTSQALLFSFSDPKPAFFALNKALFSFFNTP